MKKVSVLILNAGYWIFLLLLIAVLYAATQVSNVTGPSTHNLLVLVIGFVIVPSLVSFYGAYFFLFRLYVKKVRGVRLWLLVAVVLLLSSIVSLFNSYTFLDTNQAFFEIALVSLFLNGFNVFTGFMLRSFISWFTDIRVKEELSKKTKELELELVKLKLDPHFLFNTINNIDVLIETNNQKASEYIVKLSSLLRFYLYKSSHEMIRLSDELKYIREYIELQKIRTSNTDFVHLEIRGDTSQKEIAPMILIPFIENAFKHSVNKKTGRISVEIIIKDKQLNFKCVNRIHEIDTTDKGIGNQLVDSRLKLIYGNSYHLKILNSEEDYIVKLSLPL